MKVVIILLLLIAVGLTVAYYSGGSATYDPTQQGLAARAAITPGMTWPQVLAAAGKPGKWAKIVLEKQKSPFGGGEILVPVRKPPTDYRDGAIELRLKDNALADGFVVTYRFSRSVGFFVEFDGQGIVLEVLDAVTETDLLDMREP